MIEAKQMRDFQRTTLMSILLLLYFLMAALLPAPVLAEEDVLRVGCYDLRNFVMQDKDGRYTGYGVDYLDMLSRYTGCKFQIVVAPNNDLLRMLNSGELDLLMPVEFTPDRVHSYLYPTYPMGEQITGLYTLKSRSDIYYEDFKTFANLRIGAVKDTFPALSMAVYAKAHHFTYQEFLYSSLKDLHEAIKNGQVDAVCRSGMGNIPLDYRLVGITTVSPFYLVAPVSKKDSPFSKIDEAIKMMNYEHPNFTGDLHAKYFIGRNGTSITDFTREELEYLDEHKTFTVALFEDRYPVAYKGFSSGQPDGILKDLLDEVANKTGLKFKYEFVPKGIKLTEYLRSGNADLVAGLVNTEAMQHNYALVLSEGLMPTTTAIAGPRGEIYDERHPYRMAIPENDEGTLSHLKKFHPYLELVPAATPAAALRAVKNHVADATMQNSVVLSSLLQHDEFSNLSLWYTATDEGNFSYCVAERSTFDPRLVAIINKGIHALSRTEVQNIILKQEASIDESTTWRDYLARYAIALPVTLLLILAIAGGLLYNIQAKQQHLATLERHNAELLKATATATAAMEESRQANAAKTDFLSRMSHDIRTPLNGVIGMTGLAREQNKDSQVADFLDKIDISSHYLLDLVNDILDLAKINAGKMELHPEPYTQQEFIQYLGSVINPMCLTKKITFSAKAPTFDFALLVDKLKYNQITFNLLSNAVKFTPEHGHVSLSISSYTMQGKNCDFYIQVTDDGAGMSEAFQHKLFQPFEQELPAGTSNEKGTGLGLAITYKLIKLMGGTINVHSIPGQGTTFTVHLNLPTVPLTGLKTTPLQDAGANFLAGRTLLIAEDNPINAEILKRLLQKHGARVLMAENGAVAVQKFKDSSGLTAILMDVRMPVLDGKEATRQIRQSGLPAALTIPIIATTANAYDEDVDACLAAGMNSHVAKPIDPATLFKTLQKYLQA